MKVKLDHVNISVKNLEESLDYYAKLFDFSKVEGGVNEYGRKWAIVANEDSMIAMSEWPKRQDSIDESEKSHQHIYHFGIRVSNLADWTHRLEKYEIPLEYGQKIQYPRSTSWYVVDPSGHKVEVSYTETEKLVFESLD